MLQNIIDQRRSLDPKGIISRNRFWRKDRIRNISRNGIFTPILAESLRNSPINPNFQIPKSVTVAVFSVVWAVEAAVSMDMGIVTAITVTVDIVNADTAIVVTSTAVT